MEQVTPAGVALAACQWGLRLLLLCSVVLLALYIVSQTTTLWLFSAAYATIAAHTPFPFLADAMSYSDAFINEGRGFDTAVRIHCADCSARPLRYLPRFVTAKAHELLWMYHKVKRICCGHTAVQVWFIWGLTLVAAVASIALRRACAISHALHSDEADRIPEPSTWASAVRHPATQGCRQMMNYLKPICTDNVVYQLV